MCRFSDIKSHKNPDLPLEKHLKQVAEVAIQLLQNKKVNFPSLELNHLEAFLKKTWGFPHPNENHIESRYFNFTL